MSEPSPFEQLGPETVAEIALRFYEEMATSEPELAQLHTCDESGRVSEEMQTRFALFLTGWLGGPQVYVETHGHPRLRMRHSHIAIDRAARNAWMRCMASALESVDMAPALRRYLSDRFMAVADHLINT